MSDKLRPNFFLRLVKKLVDFRDNPPSPVKSKFKYQLWKFCYRFEENYNKMIPDKYKGEVRNELKKYF